MVCIKCGSKANEEVLAVTGKKKCVTCCIKGYRFVLFQLHKENEELEKKVRQLKVKLNKSFTS